MEKKLEIQFNESDDWLAVEAAEQWCEKHGISVGTMQGEAPRGLKRGKHHISKWRNFSNSDMKLLDGTMTGEMRNGPVYIVITEPEQL